MIRLELLNKQDYKLVIEYENLFFNSIDESDFITNFIENPLYEAYGIYFNNFFIGYIIIWLDEDKSQLYSMLIKEEYRRKNYGFMALARLEETLRSKRIKEWTLEVRESNLPAISLYTKVGFSKVAVRKNYYKNNEDAWLMYKKI
ncbi:ribosomal protein S18-alanine N-acetyltransferase [Mycoplasmatota bacterium]|nr:ribosomal protein S18-alanine N-acetyltransferase [Mycoplasmatota bacterium]